MSILGLIWISVPEAPFPLCINFLVSPYDSPGNDDVSSKFKGRWTCLGCGRLNPGTLNSVPPMFSGHLFFWS